MSDELKNVKKKKCGRKKLWYALGDKVTVSFSVYGYERDLLKSYFQDLKARRGRLAIKIGDAPITSIGTPVDSDEPVKDNAEE